MANFAYLLECALTGCDKLCGNSKQLMKGAFPTACFVRSLSVVLLVTGSLDLLAQTANSKSDTPNRAQTAAVEKRPAWTTSRITGSPEPPSPYRIERIFPKLRFVEPLELVAFPASDRFVLAEHAGKIYSFPNNPDCEAPDVFADMKGWNREIQEVYSPEFALDFIH
jgi:hypothetical protein